MDMRVTLHFSGRRARDPISLHADPEIFQYGGVVWIGSDEEPFVVGRKKLFVDASATPRLTVSLSRHQPLIRSLDRFAARHEMAVPLFGSLFVLLLVVPIILAFVVLAMKPDVRFAYAGWAIACAPYFLFFGCALGIPVIATRGSSRFGDTLSSAFGFIGALLGFILAVAWRQLFIAQNPALWPQDYVALANSFTASTASMIAVLSAYAPLVLVSLKMIGLDILGPIASMILGKGKAA
jgi:hypothetical protein